MAGGWRAQDLTDPNGSLFALFSPEGRSTCRPGQGAGSMVMEPVLAVAVMVCGEAALRLTVT